MTAPVKPLLDVSSPAVVAGSARSGQAVAELIRSQGGRPFVTDSGPVKHEVQSRLHAQGIDWEQGGHSRRAEAGEWLVLSPGVPTSSPIAQAYLSAGKPVYSELEVASWFIRPEQHVVAVTGTNGKTTVTRWIADMWRVEGRAHRAGGNLGTPLSRMILDGTGEEDLILEVSSFQLDHVASFRPNVSLLLNITPDHMDRYGHSMDAYAAAKARIAERQSVADTFIYNADDPVCEGIARQVEARAGGPRTFGFSVKGPLAAGGWIDRDQIIVNTHHQHEALMHIQELALPGIHNLGNGLASAIAARVSEIRSASIRESLEQFEGVEHRLERVRELDGVRYINDSKATNVNAVWYALDSFHVPVTLILGGRDKGNDYRELAPQLRSKVRAVVAIGESRAKVIQQVSTLVPDVYEADSMAEAVRMCRRIARRGEIVLLSPACASFDMFDSYEHRGDVFRTEVLSL